MRFLLFVEGDTEYKALKPFLHRWLNVRLSSNVGINPINLKGNQGFHRKIKNRVHHYLGQDKRGEIIAAMGLLDLYKGADFPVGQSGVDERYQWGVSYYESMVGHEKFKMFFAVHETEAWLLSDPSVFPRGVRGRIQRECGRDPEGVDFDRPPAKRLDTIYESATGKSYKKITHGTQLFNKLDPENVYAKCPHFRRMLDEMLRLATQALQRD